MSEEQTSQSRWLKLNEFFNRVVDLPTEDRLKILSELCGDDQSLFDEINDLIKFELNSEDFLHDPVNLKTLSLPLALLAGRQIGKYKVVREIERSGMGAIFEATRTDGEFEQRVAIKLINPIFINNELLERFKRERQILARLAHPNIVRLLDGGITAERVPYFVMEYIDGSPVNRYSRMNNLEIRQILKLFLQVCDAVSFAHRQLIIHRDLKPSNILVTKTGQIKLLDFGIAKILDNDSVAQTQTQNAPLTPAYASPEQIKGESITTASDVFSLGTILFELLTGKSPHELYGVSPKEVLRGVTDLEPIRPSSVESSKFKVQGSKSKSKDFDESNGNNPKSEIRNPKSLRGDLDNIILKALSKEKEHRYNSVEQFADDIKSYLNGLPVKAHPQTFKYRASKFIKRNRWSLAFASAAIILITIGVVAAVRQTIVANRQRQIAERQRQIAEQRFDEVRKIANSLIFDYHDEIAKLEGSTKLREKLVVDAVNYLNAISAENTDNPELLKELALAYRKIGDVEGVAYEANLGKSDEAVKNYQKSVALLEKAVALNSADDSLKEELINSYKSLSSGEMRVDRKEQARLDLSKAIEISDSLARADENNLDRKILSFKLQTALADTYEREFSLPMYQKTVEGLNNLFSAHPNNAQMARSLAILHARIGARLRWSGDAEEAQNNFPAAKDFYRKSVEDNYQYLKFTELSSSLRSESGNKRQMADVYTSIASSLTSAGQINEAENNLNLAERLIKQLRAGDPHNQELVLDEIAVYNVRQKILARRGKLDSALQVIKDTLKIAESAYQADLTNKEAISWVAYLSSEAKKLLIKQSRLREADQYQKIFDEYARRYRQNFGKDWEGKFYF